MKNLLFVLFAFVGFTASAQDVQWMTSFEEASKVSMETGKPILANFTGSDWCGWCIRLKKEVFSKSEFAKWAEENVVLLELDFPRTTPISDELRAQNQQLAQQFQVRGYPTIIVFDVEAGGAEDQLNVTTLGRTGYLRGGPTPWIDNVEEMMTVNK